MSDLTTRSFASRWTNTNALAESEGADRAAVLASIVRAFNVEMRSPTDEHTGGFVEGK